MPVSLGKRKIKFFQPALFTPIVSPGLGLLAPGRGFCSLPFLTQVVFTPPCHPQFSNRGGITVQRIRGSGDPSCQLCAQPPSPAPILILTQGAALTLCLHDTLAWSLMFPSAMPSFPLLLHHGVSPRHSIALNLFYIKHPLRNLQLEVKIIMIIKKL